MNYVWDLLSYSVFALHSYPWITFLKTSNKAYALFGIGLIATEIATKIIKSILYTNIKSSVISRPSGAQNCNILANDGNVSGTAGMPSNQLAVVAFFFTYLWLSTPSIKNKNTILIVGTTFTVLHAIARTRKKCHTPLQVLAGWAFGVIFAFVWFHMISPHFLEDEPQHNRASVYEAA